MQPDCRVDRFGGLEIVECPELNADSEVTPYTGQGVAFMFKADEKKLMHVEASGDGAKIIVAAPGMPVTDVIIDTNRKASVINGIHVSAGYFITDANSKGIRNIIYVASFKIDGVSVEVQTGGELSGNEKFRAEIAHIVDTMTKTGAPDLSKITG